MFDLTGYAEAHDDFAVLFDFAIDWLEVLGLRIVLDLHGVVVLLELFREALKVEACTIEFATECEADLAVSFLAKIHADARRLIAFHDDGIATELWDAVLDVLQHLDGKLAVDAFERLLQRLCLDIVEAVARNRSIMRHTVPSFL